MDIYFQSSVVCFLLHINIYLLAKFLYIKLLGQRICEFIILIHIAKLPSREVTFPLVLRIKMSANLNGENCHSEVGMLHFSFNHFLYIIQPFVFSF